jgi:hypothetical protein
MDGEETWLWMAGEGQERDGFQISDSRTPIEKNCN